MNERLANDFPRMILQVSDRDGGLLVRVIDAPGGQTAEAAIVLQRGEDVQRAVRQPTFHEDVGRGLFRSLLPGELGELFRRAYMDATLAGDGLALELRFDRDALRAAAYPWELLHDGTRFLLGSGAVSLVRALPFPAAPRPVRAGGPLEVLFAAPRPPEIARIAPGYEGLAAVLGPLVRADRLDLATLFPPTWESLLDWTLAGAPDVVHFESLGDAGRGGRPVFEDERGRADPVAAGAWGAAFYGTGLRAVMLSAPEAARSGEESGLELAAPSLVLAGVPAVVLVAEGLPDAAAAQFGGALYGALADGAGLEAAVMAGRRALARTTCWHSPALYLRAEPDAPGAGTLPGRVEIAAPETTESGQPLRVVAWLESLRGSPPAGVLRRTLGTPADPVDPAELPGVVRSGTEIAALEAGPVTLAVHAPGCEVSPAARTVTVGPGEDPPPVWLALTPRRAGVVPVTVEVAQNGHPLATATVRLRVG